MLGTSINCCFCFLLFVYNLSLLEFIEAKITYPCSLPCYCTYSNRSIVTCKNIRQPNILDNKLQRNSKQCVYSFEKEYLQASDVKIQCVNISLSQNSFQDFVNLTRMHVVGSNLQVFPLFHGASHLLLLNLSNNDISELHIPSNNFGALLEVLDLSKNRITNLHIPHSSLPHLTHLHVQHNEIVDLSSIQNLASIKILDASYNPVSLEQSQLYKVRLQELHLRSVSSVAQVNSQLCPSEKLCQVLPPSVLWLDISENHLLRFPTCDGLLAAVLNLEILLLENNQISLLNNNTLAGKCFSRLTGLSLLNNRLIKINPDFLSGSKLQSLVLTQNYLQDISISILEHFQSNVVDNTSTKYQYQNRIYLTDNPWSCDCLQNDLHAWLNNRTRSVSIVCEAPRKLKGLQLKNVDLFELVCTNVSVSDERNATKVHEYDNATLTCWSDGLPKPIVVWYNPNGEEVSLESLAEVPKQNKLYSLSHYGQMLIVKDVHLSKTGYFRCVANNSISAANHTVALSVILSEVSTIIYLVITCVAFIVAIILNSVNMCMYIYEHVQAKRKYKKAVQEQEKFDRLNPPIRQRSRALSIDESMASLNAQRHYGKYDFTCQQMFLDTVIKGAHTVKKTFYDARHSEFSANMWGYAASLKDRLHIDLPTQLPTISMPNISMPSIPTMQDINTNIEKLGTSVMTKSHNLATSVGSVFTLKRWAWQQQSSNNSDSESRSSDENLDKSDETRIKVDVHRTANDGKLDSGDESPSTSKQEERKDARWLSFTWLYSNRSDAEVSARSSKSLPDYAKECNAENKKLAKTVTFVSEEKGNGDASTISSTSSNESVDKTPAFTTVSVSVANQCHSYETSV